ncbi:cytochrome c family protein [Dethiobacter alkaliphilus]|uniref:cytochrome c family protein n=1 Tax=Dethiobacter alkaliphilus TaxID=427926 RepID=UPI00222674AB|nr:cytochrome c family protein [Dethiobacter alkaliphilus]MCW3488852.1 cytochrome c family protein [Dethiobacter alkaliphilus]
MKKSLLLLLCLALVAFVAVGCGNNDNVADNGNNNNNDANDNDNGEEVVELTYVGSDRCAACHGDEHAGWKDTQHPYMIMDADEILPEAVAALEAAIANGDEDLLRIGADGEVLTSVDQIDLVNGGFFKQRFVFRTDEGHRFLTSQFNVPSGELSPYGAGSLWEDNCIGCHSTGFDLELSQSLDRSDPNYRLEDNFAEPGVGCEACHGPGSAHIADVTNSELIVNPADFTIEEQLHFCGSCHARASGSLEVPGRNDPIGFEIGDDIFDYTKVLSPGTNQNVWLGESGRYYDSEEDGNWRFFEDGGSRSHRMQFNDLIQGPHWGVVSCTDCHDVHAAGQEHTSTGAPSTLRWAFEDTCNACHEDGQYDPEEYMPVRASSSNTPDQRNHTFLPGGVGNPDPNVPEAK